MTRRLAQVNMGLRGMVDELDVEKVRGMIEEMKIDVLAVEEHWRGAEERMRTLLGIELTEGEKERTRDLLGEEFVWVERCRKDQKRGGVGVAVRKEFGSVEEITEWSSENVLWIKIDMRRGGVMFVGVVYLVGGGVCDEFVASMERIAGALAMLDREQNVVLMGDRNGRIGMWGVGLERREVRRW